MRTEFGRGYATCLFLFLGHTRRLRRDVAVYREMRAKRHDGFWTDERAVEMWANGASDHLRDLLTPRRKIPRQSVRIARGLAKRVHGAGWIGMDSETMSLPDAEQTIKAAQRLLSEAAGRTGHRYPRNVGEAVAIDADLGLRGDPAGYRSCFRRMREDQSA